MNDEKKQIKGKAPVELVNASRNLTLCSKPLPGTKSCLTGNILLIWALLLKFDR